MTGEAPLFPAQAPEDGEAEVAAVLEGLRDAARSYVDVATPEVSPVVQAFGHIARLVKNTKADIHALPTLSLSKWARALQLPGDANCSRRQAAMFSERLDDNGDGVVSRSEFGAWLYPTRSLDTLKKALSDLVDATYGGSVANLWTKLAPYAPEKGVRRLDVMKQVRAAGGGYLVPDEVDSILRASEKSDVLLLPNLCHVLGRPEEPLPDPVKRPATRPKAKPRGGPPSPTKAAPPPPPSEVRPAVDPKTKTKTKNKGSRRGFSSKTPREAAYERLLEAEAQASAASPDDVEATDVSPPPPDSALAEQTAALAALQARARQHACVGAVDALRGERVACLELEAALLREGALRVELSRARAVEKRKLRDQRRDLEAKVAEVQDERRAERDVFDDQLRRLLEDNARLKLDAQRAKAALSDARLDERRDAARHFRKKLEDYQRRHPPAQARVTRDPGAWAPPSPRGAPDDARAARRRPKSRESPLSASADIMNMTLGKAHHLMGDDPLEATIGKLEA